MLGTTRDEQVHGLLYHAFITFVFFFTFPFYRPGRRKIRDSGKADRLGVFVLSCLFLCFGTGCGGTEIASAAWDLVDPCIVLNKGICLFFSFFVRDLLRVRLACSIPVDENVKYLVSYYCCLA
jgi:hypothetical protein